MRKIIFLHAQSCIDEDAEIREKINNFLSKNLVQDIPTQTYTFALKGILLKKKIKEIITQKTRRSWFIISDPAILLAAIAQTMHLRALDRHYFSYCGPVAEISPIYHKFGAASELVVKKLPLIRDESGHILLDRANIYAPASTPLGEVYVDEKRLLSQKIVPLQIAPLAQYPGVQVRVRQKFHLGKWRRWGKWHHGRAVQIGGAGFVVQTHLLGTFHRTLTTFYRDIQEIQLIN